MKHRFSINENAKNSLFPIYHGVILPGAVQALMGAGQTAFDFLTRHQQGDWGEGLDDAEWRRNDEAAAQGFPVLSGFYLHSGTLLFVYTFADRSKTVLFVEGEDPHSAP